MAYATIAGLPLQVGLYTAFVPMVVYAMLGKSTHAQREHHDDDRDSSAPPSLAWQWRRIRG